jgi:hypothetical protein
VPTVTAVALGCSDSSGPSSARPPYVAIVAPIDAPPGVSPGDAYTYHLKELSGTLHIDTVITASPSDTVIVPVPSATYTVELSGLPAYCGAKDGDIQAILVPPKSNTSLIRYFISCQPSLTLITQSQGGLADSAFVFGVHDARGHDRVGILGPNDTLRLPETPGGATRIDLESVAANCIVTNSGGAHRQVVVDSAGGTAVEFQLICSDPERQPQLLGFTATYHDGVAGLVFRAADPQRDLERYSFDLTDCRRVSLFRDGARIRQGLDGGDTGGLDSVTVVSAYEVGLPDDSLAGKCAALWITDVSGNASSLVEQPLGAGPGTAPSATVFDALFNTTSLIQTRLEVTDPDHDFLGYFMAYRLRDGTFGSSDGKPDFALRNTAGFLGSEVPDLPIGSAPLLYENFYSEVIYLFDAAGHFTRLQDDDLFQ